MSKNAFYLEHEFVEAVEDEEVSSLKVIEADAVMLLSVDSNPDEFEIKGDNSDNSTFAEDSEYAEEQEDQVASIKVPCSGRRGPQGLKPCNFVCDICGRELTTNGGLKVHKRIHTGETPFVCEVCERPFARQWSLMTHMKTHTNDRQYVCEQCGKSFKQSGHLTTHVRIHTGEKPFVCPTCDKAFTEGGKLDRHMRTHTGDRPYSCKVCNKRIAQYAGLLRHMRTHTGERPFQCPVCNRRFSQSGDVRRHIRTHRESKLTDNLLQYGEIHQDGQVFKLLVEDVLKLETDGSNGVSEVYFV